MNTTRLSSWVACFVACGLMIGLAACSTDDIVGEGNLTPADPAAAATQTATTQGVLMATALIDMIPGLATGQFGMPKQQATWNPSTQRWYWDLNETLVDNPPSYATRTWSFSSQYLQNEVPQQEVDGADRINVMVTFGYNEGAYTDEDNNETLSFFVQSVINITGMAKQGLQVSAGGTGELFASGAKAGHFYEVYEPLVWDADMTVIPGACPSGQALFDFSEGSMILSISFDGSNEANWSLIQGEKTQHGSTTIDCGIEG